MKYMVGKHESSLKEDSGSINSQSVHRHAQIK